MAADGAREHKVAVEQIDQEALAEALVEPIIAPSRLGILPDSLHATVTFLGAIHRRSCIDGKAALVDLTDCIFISRAACLLLTAELDRCKSGPARALYAIFPSSASVLHALENFGFFSHLEVDAPRAPEKIRRRRPNKDVILVKSGRGEDAKTQMREIADVTLRLYGDAAYAEEVATVLGEAMMNVIDHAYNGPNASREARRPGRWWFAGVVDRKRREVQFYALDHGVGIPVRAPQTIPHIIEGFWNLQPVRPVRLSSKDVLRAAVEARRFGVIARRGNGLPEIISLVEDRSLSGEVQIRSGRAGYRFVKKGPSNGPIRVQKCYGFRKPFPGTLIVWRVCGPKSAGTEVG